MTESAVSDFRMYDLRGIDWSDVSSSRTASGVRVTPESAMQCSAFMACVRVISESVASLPLHLYRRLAAGGKERAASHPLYRLLHDKPNRWQTGLEFREQLTALYLTYGQSFAEKVPGPQGPVSELWPLHPSRMRVEPLENGNLRYLYREPNGRETVYAQSQIFHLRFMTLDGINGVQPTTLSRDAIGLARALEQHGSTYFGNGARPGVILESDNPIPVEAAERLREAWERLHRGADRAFRTAVLPNGVKAKELSGSNEAAQFLETRRFQIEEVARAFRVPLHLLGELSRSTYSNIEVQGTEFVQHCLLPHLRRWETAIARDLIDGDVDEYFAEHSVTGLLRGDHASRSAYYVSAIQNGWMSVNEVRELENMNPLGPEGERHFIQMNMTTLEDAGDADDTSSPDDIADSAADDDNDDSDSNNEPAPQQTGDGETMATTDLQQQALNGAQVSSLLEIIANLSAGLLNAAGAKALIQGAFPTMPENTIDQIIGGVNEGVLPPQQQTNGGQTDGT